MNREDLEWLVEGTLIGAKLGVVMGLSFAIPYLLIGVLLS